MDVRGEVVVRVRSMLVCKGEITFLTTLYMGRSCAFFVLSSLVHTLLSMKQ